MSCDFKGHCGLFSCSCFLYEEKVGNRPRREKLQELEKLGLPTKHRAGTTEGRRTEATGCSVLEMEVKNESERGHLGRSCHRQEAPERDTEGREAFQVI